MRNTCETAAIASLAISFGLFLYKPMYLLIYMCMAKAKCFGLTALPTRCFFLKKKKRDCSEWMNLLKLCKGYLVKYNKDLISLYIFNYDDE